MICQAFWVTQISVPQHCLARALLLIYMKFVGSMLFSGTIIWMYNWTTNLLFFYLEATTFPSIFGEFNITESIGDTLKVIKLKNWITCLLNYFELFDNNLFFASMISKNFYSLTIWLFLLLKIFISERSACIIWISTKLRSLRCTFVEL